MKFVIAKDGTVNKAETKSTTMNNAAVEGCLTTSASAPPRWGRAP